MMVGTVPAGTTAYTIPKIDEYLKEQGFDKEVRDTALLALSAGIGATVGGDTASTANNVGQVQWNYLSHTELSVWKTSLIKCSGNQQCIDNVNTEYNNLNKINFNTFENYCTINFDAQRCSNLISRFQNGTQGDYNLKHLPALYTDISRLGGTNASATINSVKINSAFYGYRVRDIGVANVNRYNGNKAQALIGEITNARDYGVGRGGKNINSSKPINHSQRDLDPAFKNGYIFKRGVDIDFRNTGKTQKDALDLAFQKTGVNRSEFSVTKWAKDKNGKSFPVEYRVLSGKNRGADVSIDVGHTTQGTPGSPHIGWQTPGKNNTIGHIFVDKVDVNRGR